MCLMFVLNIANAFDGMKDYIPDLTSAAEMLCYQLRHTCSLGKHAHTRRLTGKALACSVCWHGLKVYVTVCIPEPVFVSLASPCQSLPWHRADKALGTADSIVGILAADSGSSKVCRFHNYPRAVRLIRQQWEPAPREDRREQRAEQVASASVAQRVTFCLFCSFSRMWFGWWNGERAVKRSPRSPRRLHEGVSPE